MHNDLLKDHTAQLQLNVGFGTLDLKIKIMTWLGSFDKFSVDDFISSLSISLRKMLIKL